MARTLRRENYPLTAAFVGGRVDHIAREMPGQPGLLQAGCGKRGRQAPSTGRTCQACANQPWTQDQRTYLKEQQ